MDTSLEKAGLIEEGHRRYLLSRGYRPKTVAAYHRSLKEFFWYVKEEEGRTDLKEVDRGLVRRYQNYLFHPGRKLSLNAQMGKLSALKSLYRYLEKEEWVLYNPASQIEFPHLPQRLPRAILSEEEMKRVLSVIRVETPMDLRDKAMMELLYSTGIRSGEMGALDVYDLNQEGGMLTIREGKGAKDRVVPVGEIAMTYVREYGLRGRPKLLSNPDERALFLSQTGRRLDQQRIGQVVKIYVELAGLEKRVTPHTIRHTTATHMLRGGAGIRYIQELLGHARLDTTQGYTQVEIVDLKKVHAETHPRG